MARERAEEFLRGLRGAAEAIAPPVARNPNYIPVRKGVGLDSNQVRACYRYIRSQYDTRGGVANNIRSFCRSFFGATDIGGGATTKTKLVAAATDLNGVRASFAAGDEIDYLHGVDKGPNTAAALAWDKEITDTSRAFQRQMAYEAEMWALNLEILKGCFIGYVVTREDQWSPYFIGMLTSYVGYRGPPIYAPSSTRVDFVDSEAHLAGGGRRRRARYNGGRRRFRGRRRRYY